MSRVRTGGKKGLAKGAGQGRIGFRVWGLEFREDNFVREAV